MSALDRFNFDDGLAPSEEPTARIVVDDGGFVLIVPDEGDFIVPDEGGFDVLIVVEEGAFGVLIVVEVGGCGIRMEADETDFLTGKEGLLSGGRMTSDGSADVAGIGSRSSPEAFELFWGFTSSDVFESSDVLKMISGPPVVRRITSPEFSHNSRLGSPLLQTMDSPSRTSINHRPAIFRMTACFGCTPDDSEKVTAQLGSLPSMIDSSARAIVGRPVMASLIDIF